MLIFSLSAGKDEHTQFFWRKLKKKNRVIVVADYDDVEKGS